MADAKQERLEGHEGQNDEEITKLAQEVKVHEQARMAFGKIEKVARDKLTALMVKRGFSVDDVYEDTDQVPPVKVKLKGGALKASVETKAEEEE